MRHLHFKWCYMQSLWTAFSSWWAPVSCFSRKTWHNLIVEPGRALVHNNLWPTQSGCRLLMANSQQSVALCFPHMLLHVQGVLSGGTHPCALYLPGELGSGRGITGESTSYGILGWSFSGSLPGSGLTLAGCQASLGDVVLGPSFSFISSAHS